MKQLKSLLISASPGPRARRAACVIAVCGAAVSFLSGCMVGPDYEAPDVQLNDAWLGLPPEETESDGLNLHARWWETFDDPVLTALIAEAYEQNLTLRVAGLRVLEARARRQIAVGQFFPQLQEAFGGINTVRLSENTADGQTAGQIDQSFSQASLGLQAVFELDFWGKFRRAIEASDAQLLSTVADYDTTLTILLSDVASSYIAIRSLQERLRTARANVALQERTLQLTDSRFRAGDVSELDVVDARATLANTRATIPELENALRQTKLALGVLLGRAPSELDAELAPVGGAEARVPTAPAAIAAGIPADLLRRRPDVRAAERLAAASSAAIGVATADLFPRISIVGVTGFATSTFDGVRSPDLGNLFDADSFTGFLGLEVNWPILNYGRITGNIQVQDARFEQAVASYQEAVLRAAADVEAGLSEFLRSRETETQLAVSVAALQRSAEIAIAQYRAGLVSFIRVNDALLRLTAQEDNLIEARARIALGAVRTYRALGGGWQFREGTEFIDSETAERMRERTNWGDILSPEWEEGSDFFFPRPQSILEETSDEESPAEAPAADGAQDDPTTGSRDGDEP